MYHKSMILIAFQNEKKIVRYAAKNLETFSTSTKYLSKCVQKCFYNILLVITSYFKGDFICYSVILSKFLKIFILIYLTTLNHYWSFYPNPTPAQ